MQGRGSKKVDYNKANFKLVFIDNKLCVCVCVCVCLFVCVCCMCVRARARALEVALPPQPNESPICCAAIQFYYSNLINSSRESISGLTDYINWTRSRHCEIIRSKEKKYSYHKFTSATETTSTTSTTATTINASKAAAAADAA